MSDAENLLAGLICEKPACSSFIYDQCDVCNSSFCQECINYHDCGQSSSSLISSSVQDHFQEAQSNVVAPAIVTMATATSSLASATSSVALSKKIANPAIAAKKGNKRKFFEKKTIEVESIKNFHADLDSYEARRMKLAPPVPNANLSWVWQHFRKFDHKEHPELKEHACCNHCFAAAKSNESISFTVLYTVSLKDALLNF